MENDDDWHIDMDWQTIENAYYSYGWIDCKGIEGKKLPTRRIMKAYSEKHECSEMNFNMTRQRRRVKEVEDAVKRGKKYKLLHYEYDPQFTKIFVCFDADMDFEAKFLDMGGHFTFFNIPDSTVEKFPLNEFVYNFNDVRDMTSHSEKVHMTNKSFRFPESMGHDDRFEVAMASVEFIENWFKTNPGVTTLT